MVTIEVSEEIWRTLMVRKRPGDSFDDVLRRELLDTAAEPEPEHDDPAPDSADRYADLEFPRDVDRDAAIAAIEVAADLIEREGQATMREIVEPVSQEHPLKYGPQTVEEGERYRKAWWRSVVKPGLEQHPNIEKPSGGQRAWDWRD